MAITSESDDYPRQFSREVRRFLEQNKGALNEFKN
jgi:hypothetical protein